MNFIIYDLEATCWRGRPPQKIQETIEIGALLVNDYGEVEDVFSRFVRPIVSPNLSAFCEELTSIRQEDIDRAETFDRVIDDFFEWGRIDEEDYVLCSWGSFDKKMFIQDCELHDLDPEWARTHINLKRQYQGIRRSRKPFGLRRAVESEGFEFTGTHHRAIADAENLTKIFTKYLDMWQY